MTDTSALEDALAAHVTVLISASQHAREQAEAPALTATERAAWRAQYIAKAAAAYELTRITDDYRKGRLSMTKLHPNVQHLLNLFEYEHLPQYLQSVSKPFSDMAHQMSNSLHGGPELTVGLRKLLEAKDCMVRQAVIDRHADA